MKDKERKREYDEQKLTEQFRKIEDAQSRLSEARFAFVLEVRKILTYEQFQQLMQEFQDYRHKHKEFNEHRRRKLEAPIEPPDPRPQGAQ